MRIGIVGSGFSGLCAAIRLQQAGFGDITLYERAADLGGTWRDNTYPGCACDIPSNLYSFSFEPNPEWTRMYPQQAEIRAYLERVAAKHGLRERIRFGKQLAEAAWDDEGAHWRLRFLDGSSAEAEVLIGAIGPLSRPRMPELAGIESFGGAAFHSSQWRHDLDLAGKRIAVIGTGASAIQFVPKIAPQAARVHVYQRTPPWVLPLRDRPFEAWERRLYRALPLAQRLLRWTIYLRQELLVRAFLGGAAMQRQFREVGLHFLGRQVPDAALRAKLAPDYAPGCKRLLISNTWYPALQRPNVELLAEGVAKLEGKHVVGESGGTREVDVVIFATGFITTEFVSPMKITGRNGADLAAVWKAGAATHLGISVAGLPNFYLLAGPNTALGHNSLVFMIEAQVNYVVGALRRMRRARLRTMEVRPEVQARSYADVQQRMKKTVWASGCRSWYMTADGRNDTLWPGSTLDYWRRTLRFDARNYS